jgi:UDP-N-acetylglucosamine 2-epimerase (non-hydrolysing)/GDP/UDP-N,N'-diacetylbacillosamine 2-epimerase (hydrolysing)
MGNALPCRRVCVVTGTRADYGLLHPLMRAIADDERLELQVLATGMHMSAGFGLTYREIEQDGLRIDAKVEMLLDSDTAVGIAKSMGIGTIGIAEALDRLRPDIVVILGDRFEALAAAQAALVARIPVAHIHGGESSEGSYDDSMRHAITKIARWHFVAAEPYRKRVIQLGEAPHTVFNFGAPGLDRLSQMEWLDRGDLERSLGLRLGSPLVVVTFHPATLSELDPVLALEELLAALDSIPDATVVFTFPNADAGGRALAARMRQWIGNNPGRSAGFASLGQRRYLSLVRESDVVLGNSSSALIEVPALRKAAVNVGERQAGRLRATSVIDAPEERSAIAAAIARALSAEFRAGLGRTVSPYGEGGASARIRDVLRETVLGTRKKFFDIRHEA